MIKINDLEFFNSPVIATFSSYSPDEIMEDKTVATDNNTINPVTLEFTLYYREENYLQNDYREKKKLLEDLFYSPENLVVVEDLVENTTYSNMMIQGLKNWEYFKNGFACTINLKQALLTEKAEPGKAVGNRSQRNIKYLERPLKNVSIASQFLPDVTISSLTDMGIQADRNGLFNLKCLDFGGLEELKSKVSSSILTTLGNNKINFNLLKDGTMEILTKGGEYLAAGQRMVANVEMLANMIPGVNFSMKVLPISQKAVDKYFDILSLGKEWEVVINEIQKGAEDNVL